MNLALFKFTNRADRAISATGWYVNEGVAIAALAGNDRVIGTGGEFNRSIQILKGGSINSGGGNNVISGAGGFYDGIYNEGAIITGAGNDLITGSTVTYNAEGTINTGSGNYKIIGTGISYNIYNDGIIKTGSGEDTVSALEGGVGFGGSGKTYLGPNNDTLKGFGTGYFYGGSGKDKILFGEGTYIVSKSSISLGDFTMNVFGFETIGGANGGFFAFKNGTLNVNATGVGTFA